MEYCYKYNFKPRHTDLDVFRIAHHSKFFCWFEEARYDLFTQLPTAFDSIIDKYGFPVTRLECKYLRSVSTTANMTVNVILKVNSNTSILHFDYRLLDSTERILHAKAYTEHVLLDCEGRILKSYPEDVENLWAYLIKKKEIQLDLERT